MTKSNHWGRVFILTVIASFTALSLAFWFQYARGLAPCSLCLINRWLYATLGGAGVVALVTLSLKGISLAVRERLINLCFRISWLVSVLALMVSLFHSGLERRWWQVKMSCTSAVVHVQTLEDYKARLSDSPRCDRPSWRFGGVSLTEWNGLYHMMILAFLAWHRPKSRSLRSRHRTKRGGNA